MLNDYQIFSIGEMKLALCSCAGASVGYLLAAKIYRDKMQLLMVLPGVLVLAAIALAIGIAPYTDSHSTFGWAGSLVFTGLLILALGVDFAAMYARGGCTVADVLQFLLLPSIPWVWFIGFW